MDYPNPQRVERRRGPPMDTFTENVKNLIEKGSLAHMTGNAFKSLTIQEIQAHSSEIPLLAEEISELFLILTDLLVSGNLSKMPQNAFKIYLVLATYGNGKDLDASSAVESERLRQLTGIGDESAFLSALEELREMGYIDSVERPALRKNKRRNGSEDDELGSRLFSS
jgi:hypothetical protein